MATGSVVQPRRSRFPRSKSVIPIIVVTMVAVLFITLSPGVSRVYAASVFGALRAPGEPAFVAGHRGDRSNAPENTLPALQAALDSSLAFVETDVQLSKDGVPVLIHDESVDRTTNGKGAVDTLTLKQLKKLDAGKWYAPRFAGTRIPTLDEFLEVFAAAEALAADKKVLMELKGFWPKENVQTVVELIEARGVEGRVTLASFDYTTLMNIEKVGPSFPRVIITRELPGDPVGLATHFGAIAILTSADGLREHPAAVEEMHEAGLGLLLYTLNSEERWGEALALGVDGIITDKPSTLDKWLAETAPGT
ncbi:hypothetical protein EYE40_02675 [Glaciihabitans arcticus]|uniref:GP-PDE domain-containing protein n=1 Tax=Glaciihabitans arcticus TaxID=2668039 RepID=A0A4V2JEP5_9MICO|nr:glycerophosphodiester phosphodiesterase family protein [Glaciihabitans arcticus]TBN56389.1 hypothetical protein EYE40_02675 [Glaciihabitans arcticus]